MDVEILEVLFGKLIVFKYLKNFIQKIYLKKFKLVMRIQKVKVIYVLDIDRCCYIFCMKFNKVWVGDELGNLVEIDLKGNEFYKIKIYYFRQQLIGFYVVILEDELLFIDQYDDSIFKLFLGRKKKILIKFKEWILISIYVFYFMDDMLVGMVDDIQQKVKVVWYDVMGKELKMYEFYEDSKK